MKALVIGTICAALSLTAAGAAEIEVKMLNKGAEGVMVFEPALVKAALGDTVKFVATDKGHNVESIEGMLPDGIKSFVGKYNEEIVLKLDKPGIYGVRCKPHYAMGMVGLIVVGEPLNEEKAKAVTHPGRANQIFAKLFDRLAATRTAGR